MGKDSNISSANLFYTASSFSDKKGAGGKTGSYSAKLPKEDSEQRYQVKLSVFNNQHAKSLSKVRALIGNKDSHLDTENFREKIATDILREIAVEDRKDLVPQINFIIDDTNEEDKRRIGITSKWLPKPSEEDLNPEKEKSDRAAGLAEFMYMGNHDCNEGNFLKSGNRIAAIDYGKAFNALLNAPKRFGGKLRYPENHIIDYLNRESLPSGRDITPKLWQDENKHGSLVPSEELVAAMEAQAAAASPENIQKGIDSSKSQYMALLNKKDEKGEDFFDKAHKEHIVKSVIEVARNIEGAKISFDPKKTHEDNLDAAFEVIKASQIKRAKEMKEAARIMKAQLALDKLLSNKKNTPTIEDIKKWSDEHKIDLNKPITWIKPSKSEKAVTGTVRDYIKRSHKRLDMKIEAYHEILSHTEILEKTGKIARIKRALSPIRKERDLDTTTSRHTIRGRSPSSSTQGKHRPK